MPPRATPEDPYGSGGSPARDSSNRPGRGQTDVVGARIAAQVLDIVLMTVLFLAAAAALGALVGGNGSRVLVYALFLLFPLYGGLFEGYNGGQTPGKAALGIRVVSDQGGDCSPGQAFLRNLPAVFVPGTLVYIVALASMAASDRRQRVFDHLASTVVVRA